MTTPIPDEAIRLAMASRAHDLADRPDPMVLSDETLTRRMLEAAAPKMLAAERHARMAEQDAMHADLKDLLRALGMFDGARPQSPHEVMQEAIAAVRGIAAAERARILALLAAWECTCGERDCTAYDTRDRLAALIEENPS